MPCSTARALAFVCSIVECHCLCCSKSMHMLTAGRLGRFASSLQNHFVNFWDVLEGCDIVYFVAAYAYIIVLTGY
ncbi:hypothetical protein K492DRAFT_42594 [Lichtheimia hyalospora FSU 10163]|nr:hypothetical protein K492DRAFT_42594 [Lichtheimia hyalospora FSU 10163]